MIEQFFSFLDDPDRILFGRNYRLLSKIGMLYGESVIEKYLKMTLHAVGTLFIISQYVELYIIRSDLDMVLTNLTITTQSTICVIKAWSFLLCQDKWRQVIDYITEADKYERDNQDKTKKNIIKSYTTYSRRLNYVYWFMAFSTLVAICGAPTMKYMTSRVYREKVRNGTVPFPHIFSAWVPFDKTRPPGCWITAAWHLAVCIYGVTTVGAYDCSIMVMLAFFGARFDLMSIRCREMLGTDGKVVNDEDSDKALREIHGIHVLHLKYSKVFNSVSSPVMFCYIIMCSLMICASAFQLSSTTNAAQKLLLAEFFIFAIAQLLLFCWHSDEVIWKSRAAEMGPYKSQWWAANIRQRKNVVILQGQLRTPHHFTAGPFTNLTLATFLTVLKGAYSYYTMVRQ
uniref:Odorant receptor n=1 Tax=Grapholita molesta TaxID=192188 RepID=A0A9Y1IQE9_GRAMO|nr:odorant-receptor-32 [Grapholita molesta]